MGGGGAGGVDCGESKPSSATVVTRGNVLSDSVSSRGDDGDLQASDARVQLSVRAVRQCHALLI